MEHLGHANGEEAERFFSMIGALAATTRTMTAANRIDTISALAENHNRQKTEQMPIALCDRRKRCLQARDQAVKTLREAVRLTLVGAPPNEDTASDGELATDAPTLTTILATAEQWAVELVRDAQEVRIRPRWQTVF